MREPGRVCKDFKDKSDLVQEFNRNIDFYKELIIKPNVPLFFNFIDSIERISLNLNKPNSTIEQKQQIKEDLDDEFSKLRKKFIDNIGAVDVSLQNSTQKLCDDLQDYFAETIFDDTIDLTQKALFDDSFLSRLEYFKTDLLKQLFKYRG